MPSSSNSNKGPSPHGAKTQVPKIVPAADLERGVIGVLLTTSDFQNVSQIAGQEVRLSVSKQSIERGNKDSVLVEKTDDRGRVYFPPQPTETDHVYRVSVTFQGATFSSNEFQFRAAQQGGLRVLVPVFASTDSLDGLLVLSRSVVALTPQDDLFVVNVIWRVENYSEKAWTPKDIGIALPSDFRALTIQSTGSDARFEPDGDKGVKFAGTFVPGQHDLTFRFHLPTDGQSERQFYIPTPAHIGSMRIIVDGSPDMKLDVEGFPAPEVTRNQDGQRRLVVTRDFLREGKRPPDLVRVKLAGIPTPPGGKYISVGVAAAIALAGLGHNWGGRRRAARTPSNLSKEERERASELLLEEMLSLEQAFEQGAIGRKTHEHAKRQLLEAYSRLGLGQEAERAA
jgi:hypothetical protein